LWDLFSSAIATIVFMSRHLVERPRDRGARRRALGARPSIRLGDRWARRIAVWALGLRALLFDVLPSVSPAGKHGGEH